jgi:hypothetical protein
MRTLVISFIVFVLISCGRSDTVSLRDQRYTFPKGAVQIDFSSPDGESHVNVRLPNTAFDLIHSTRRDATAVASGQNKTIIYGRNDVPSGHSLLIKEFSGGETVCDER